MWMSPTTGKPWPSWPDPARCRSPRTRHVYVWSAPDGASVPTIELHVADCPGNARRGRRRGRRRCRRMARCWSSTRRAWIPRRSLPNAVTAPFVVSVDRTTASMKVLANDAARPVVSGDGLHVAYVPSCHPHAVVDDGSRPVCRRYGPPHRRAGHGGAREPSLRSPGSVGGSCSTATMARRSPTFLPILLSGVMVWAADLRAALDGSVVDTTTTTTPPPPPPPRPRPPFPEPPAVRLRSPSGTPADLTSSAACRRSRSPSAPPRRSTERLRIRFGRRVR